MKSSLTADVAEPSSIGKASKKRPVSFGNPALGTYHGYVYTVESKSDAKKNSQEGNTVQSLVAMVNVPPEQVPEGILHVMAPHSSWISHVRIVIAEDDPSTKKQQPLRLKVEEGEEPSLTDYDDRSYLVLIEFFTAENAQAFVDDVHGQPYTSLDESVVCHVNIVVDLEGVDGVSVMSPFFAAMSAEGTKQQQQRAVEDYNCAVCLERMDLATPTCGGQQNTSSILTTVCNHSFHMPCLEQWQDSPCPVCRYDHSGLNEALSRCHICGTTENNYVCLICGVVSCVEQTTAILSSECTTTQQQRRMDTAISPSAMAQSHARRHYDETLHAYALHTESQHVWDFAGQGYVHRLLQNKEDGKLVEVNDPQNTSSQERTLTPGLSEAQESEVVHRKLEGFASQYYTLLKSQLEQQRIYFEGQLEEIRREHTNTSKDKHKECTTADLIAALKTERSQLSHRLSTLKARNNKVKEDVSFIVNLNEGLESNREPLRQQVKKAQQEQLEQRQMFESCLPPLQEKVTRLMLQLENGMVSEMSDESKPRAR